MAATFLNARRLRDYPRLVAIAVWGVTILNFILRNGWIGGFGGVFSYDFLAQYSAGILLSSDIENLYNLQVQAQVQQEVFRPTFMGGGLNVFASPPYVAMFYRLLTHLEYGWAFAIITMINILLAIAAGVLLQRWLVPKKLKESGLSAGQMIVLILSSSPVWIGVFLGQNNTLTLFLMAVALVMVKKGSALFGGFVIGLLIYKPQLVIGFLIVWLVWKEWRALAGFSLAVGTIVGITLLLYGISPFISYFNFTDTLSHLVLGLGRYMETTLFALVATLLPGDNLSWLLVLNIGVLFVFSILLGLLAYLSPKMESSQNIIWGLVILFPFFTSPHLLYYDLVLLIPVLILWSRQGNSQTILWVSVLIYIGLWLLPSIARITDVGLLALFPLGLGVLLLREMLSHRKVNCDSVTAV
jgi:hypothetical protein